jgi:gas vesicle protein
MSNRKIVVGILTGIAAGAAISLILSTKKGRQTGKELLKKGNNLKEDLKGKFNEFIELAADRIKGI